MATPKRTALRTYCSEFRKLNLCVYLAFLSVFTLSFSGFNPNQSPAPGVMTELLFSEGAGTTTADGSGNNHSGTLVNSPVWGPGKYGQGLTFNGTNSFVDISDHADFTLDPALSYTWSAWLKNADFHEWSTVFSQTIDGNNFFYFYAHTTNDPDGGPVTNGISVYWWGNGGTNKLGIHSNNNVLTLGQWSYVTVTYDAGQPQNNRFSIYINGADVTNRTDVSSLGTLPTINPTNIRIAGNAPFGEYLNGSVDEVRYYRRLLSLSEIQSDMNIGNVPDTQAPTVNITAPAAGNVTGTINVTANAADNVGVTGVQFLLDGINLGAEDIVAPYSVSWNTVTATNGNHNLTARARDAAGNNTTSLAVAVNVSNITDTESPTVNITSPAGGTVLGTINVNANATDNIGVAGVQFLLNGANLGAEDIVAPYTVSWNTGTTANGNYTLTARARDAFGNTSTSAQVLVTVSNTNLVAAYGFNENTGTLTSDNSGNNNTGTLTNGPAWSPAGKYGSAILFDGTNDFVNINDANSLDLTNGMTIEAWVNPSVLTGFKTIICKDRTASSYTYSLSANNNNSNVANQRPVGRARMNNTNRTVTGTSKLPLNTWTHVASTYDGVTYRLFINGVQVASLATTGNLTVTTDPLRIGGTTALSAQYFTGLIDEVRIYNSALSATEIQADMITPIAPDVTNPTVAITAPLAGDVSGTINVTANASDNIGVSGVQFKLNGVNLGAEDIAAPYSVSWNTLTATNGPDTLTATARDAAGNITTSAEVIINVNNGADAQAPTVGITAPAAGNVSGTINVTANASDNIGVVGVQFKLNGVNLGAEDVASPYSVSWNTLTSANGSYTLTAVARDAAGNTTTSAGVIVTVNNDTQAPAVNITAPAAGDVSGTINVTANASDNVGIVGVQFKLNGANLDVEDVAAPYSVPWNTLTVTNGSYTLTAVARDAIGNTTTSAGVIVEVNNAPDSQAPTVAITAPTAGNVSGAVNVTANASDNIGVVGVQFKLNGANLGAEDISSPYAYSWNTSTSPNGTYTLTAVARDEAGNTTASVDVVVSVNNAGNLIAALPINEGSGTATADISGNSHPGTLTNAPVWGAGKYGQGLTFNGTNNYVNIADHNDFTLDPAQSYTWSAWVKNNDFHEWSTVFSQTVDGNSFFYFYAHTTNDPDGGPVTNGISVYWWAGGGSNKLGTHSNNNVLTLGQWSYVAVTYDASQPQNDRFSIYINGADVTNRTDVASVGTLPAINPTNIRIAGNAPFGEYLNGAVDEVRFYKRLLTVTEIATDMNTPMGVVADNTAPTVSITSPAAGNVTGTISVTANASDNVGVAGVQFLLNGANLGTEDIASPYSISWNTTTVANGTYTLTARARDAAGNTTTSAGVVVTVNNDIEVPTVIITAPAAGIILGTINVDANASDNVGVTGVQFLLDGANLGAEDVAAPYSLSWNTTTATNGTHTLTARARDAGGNTTTSAGVVVTVNNDIQAPTVSITSPAAGTILETINVDANASDNVGVAGVQFLLDGANLGTEDVAAPYTVSWNTTTITDGSHSLTARARDAAGNTATSAAVVVTVQNNPPDIQAPTVSITAPPAGTVAATISVTANASDNVGVAGVQFLLNGANLGTEDIASPYSISWNTTTVANGTYTLTARARDAAGNTATSAGVVVTVNNDTQAPTVNITGPAAGTILGTINVSANAADNVGVVGVQFLLDGANLGTEDVASPYSISWNTTTIADGSHTLTARARDASGNTTTSVAVVVTVQNDIQAPTVSITAPSAGNVSGAVNVTANASDNVGVSGVQFKLNGVNLGAEDVSSPYSYSWNTSTSPNGSYTLTAVARDAAGNTTTSAGVAVSVNNATNLIAALGINEGSGTTVADISGNNHNGTLTNSPIWGAGKYGQGLTFNGTSNYVSIADHNNFTLDPAQSYTWSSWVKNTTFVEWSTVWSQTLDGNNFFYFYAHTTNDPDGGPVTNGISVYWWANGGSNKLGVHSNNNVLTLGQWSYVAVTYDASQPQNNRFTIYVNGVDVTNRTDVASVGTLPTINPTNIRIASNQPFGEYLNGSVDEVRFYRRLLTIGEVVSDMNAPIGIADNTGPTVSITSPAAGNVSGTINVNANASDNVGVVGVQFLLDGVDLGAEDVAAPYSVPWNTSTATGGNHTLTARARDAAGNNTTSAGVIVNIVPDFSFTVLNSTRNVDPTGSTDFGVSIAWLNGFNSNVNLSVTGLPAGVTGSYAVNPMTGQGQTLLLINTTNATPGVYTITFTATAQSLVHSQQATLIVNGGDDFGLTAATSVQSVAAGSGTSYFVNITKSGNFAGTVNLSITGLPANMTGTFNPVSGAPPLTSVLTITTLTSTPVGNYNFTIQGTSGALVHTLPITLTVLATPPVNYPVTNLGSGWAMPVGVLFTKDGQKMFVWEKGGVVYVCNRNVTTGLYDKQATPVIDMSAETGNWNDMGFLGFALDPAFETNGLIYMSYIVDRHHLLYYGTPAYDPAPADNVNARKATIGRITRYQTVNNGGIITANPATRTILLGETKKTGIPILYDSHGVGTLAFAADGTLIASCGDAASYSDYDQGSVATTYYLQALADSIIRPNENVGSYRSQMLTCLNGKILRLNPANGDGMPSNPFYDPANPRSAKSRTYALGLRNPYRFSIRPGTGSTNPDAGDIGEIYVGDVGMGTWEELNVIKEPGTNCGWPFYEGLQLMPQFQDPVQNKDEPNPLFGTGGCNQQFFTFLDLFRQATADNVKTVYNPCNLSQPIGTGARFVHRRPLIDYKHDADVARVGIFSGNTASVATIGTGASGVTGTPFRGNAITGGVWYTGTLFPTNFRNTFLYGDYGRSFIKSLTVNFTDVLQKVEHFADVATPVCLTENPLDGTLVYCDVETNTVKRLSYGGNQFPVIKMASNIKYGPSPLNVTFNSNGSFDPEGGRLTYSWNFGDGSALSTAANPPVHSFTAPAGVPTKFVVTLTVKDSVNATAVDSIIISVNNTPPVVNITSPIKNSTYDIGLDSIYAMTAAVSDAEHNNGQLKYEWQQILRHNVHEHPGPIDTARVTFAPVARIGCNGDDYYWLFRLKVTDAAGLSTMDSSKIFPNCSPARIGLALRKFSVTPESTDKNLVKWMTDMAPQIRSFEIERGFDGVNFFTIASQDAKNTTGIKEYSFDDTHFAPGLNYYRLKMIEVGDVVRYSVIVKVVTATPNDDLYITNSGLTIIPNPATSNFSIKYDAKENGPITIRITDINGRVITSIHETVNKGQNIIYIQSLPSWIAGIYLVTVQQGNDMQKGKLMKTK